MKKIRVLVFVMVIIMMTSALSFADNLVREDNVISKNETVINGFKVVDTVKEIRSEDIYSKNMLRGGSFTQDIILQHTKYFIRNGVTYLKLKLIFIVLLTDMVVKYM